MKLESEGWSTTLTGICRTCAARDTVLFTPASSVAATASVPVARAALRCASQTVMFGSM